MTTAAASMIDREASATVQVAPKARMPSGGSAPIREVLHLVQQVASHDSSVLILGESGTGKDVGARAIHESSRRRGGPFVAVNCGAIPADLLESELFGHEKGSFTGAIERRAGAFEQAHGGTVFLDEIGELPIDLQPKLLRVLENREIRRVGGGTTKLVDVRLIAATNRDLRAEVNAGRFRSDLYFRLAVVKATLPPLRQRPEDIPSLVDVLLTRLGAGAELRQALAARDVQARLARAAWPGNVRELRNYLERCLVYDQPLPVGDHDADQPAAAAPAVPSEGGRLPFSEARAVAMQVFERHYLEELMAEHGEKMSEAAARAGIGRVYLYKLLVRHGLK